MALESKDDEEVLILTDVSKDIEELKRLKAEGDYEQGAKFGNALYERVKAGFVEDFETTRKDLLLIEIIALAGWMQYARVEKNKEQDMADCLKWRDRAQEVRGRLAQLREDVEQPGQADIGLRAAIATAETKAHLQEIRSGWKLGQFHTKGKEQHETVKRAIEDCDRLAEQGKVLRSADQMGEALRKDPEYIITVADARRMKGVMIGLSYIWRENFQMIDHDAAERTLPGNGVYERIVEEAEKILNEFLGKHPYADYEHIRYLKMTGKYLDAFKHAEVVRKKPGKEGDSLYLARLANIIAELKMILAEQILAALPDSKQRGEFELQGIAAAEAFGVAPIFLTNLRGESLANTLLHHAFRDIVDVLGIQDRATARTLQYTLLDVGTDILQLRQEDAGSMKNRIDQMQKALKPEFFEFDDEEWFFGEAPLLAEFWLKASEHDMDIDFVKGIDRAHFRRARSRIALELGKRNKRNDIPPGYFGLLRKKHDMIHHFLAMTSVPATGD